MISEVTLKRWTITTHCSNRSMILSECYVYDSRCESTEKHNPKHLRVCRRRFDRYWHPTLTCRLIFITRVSAACWPGLRGTGRICLKSEHMFCVYDVFSCRNVLSHQAASPTTGPRQIPFSSQLVTAATLSLWLSPRTRGSNGRLFCFLSWMMISSL